MLAPNSYGANAIKLYSSQLTVGRTARVFVPDSLFNVCSMPGIITLCSTRFLLKGSFTLAMFVCDNACDRNVPICVPLPKVAKASTVTCCRHRIELCGCRWRYRANLRQWKHIVHIWIIL
jgi:hypothetical protein